MPNRFWVGGTATWDATVGTKWATTTGGAGGASVPTAADDVLFDLLSGAGATTISSSSVCRSLDSTGYTGSLSWGSSSTATLMIGDASGGALTIGVTTSITNLATTANAIQFVSTTTNGGAGWPVTTNGRSMPSLTFVGVGGKWTIQDALTLNIAQGSAAITLTSGTLDTNNQTITGWSVAVSGALTRTLTLGTSSLTLASAGVPWSSSTITNLTLSAASSTITCNAANATFTGGALTYGTVVLTGSGTQTVSTGSTFGTLTRTGTAAKSDVLSFSGTATITGTFTVTGNSVTNRVLVQSSVVGTARTITAAVVSLTNADFIDIAGAGAASPFTGTSLGDALGNTGITFDGAVTQTHTASVGGNWSDVTKWTSRVPLPQDNVIVDVNTTGTLTADMPRLGKDLTFTGFAGTAAFGTLGISIFGSFTLSSAMSVTGSQNLTFAGRSSHTLTFAGRSLLMSFTQASSGGTYAMNDALSTTSGYSLSAGTLTTNGFSFTAYYLITTSSVTKVLNAGSTVFTLTGASAPTWNLNGTGLTVNAASATIVIATAYTASRTFNGGGFSYGTLTYTVASSPGALVITGANTFTTLNVGSGRQLTLPASTINTVTNFNVNGAVNGYVYLPGVSGDYLSAPDSAALSITADITIDVKAAMDDWTPVAISALVAKFGASGSRSYRFYVNTTGTLAFEVSNDGAANPAATSSASTGLTDGSVKWLRVTWEDATNTCKFYMSDDGSSWTQLGTSQTLASVGIFDSTAVLEVGSTTVGTLNLAAVKLYSAKVYNAYLQTASGTPVFDADFTTKPFGANTFTESSSNAATVTVNGATAQAGDGRVAITSSTGGTQATLSKASGVVSCDYLSLQDSAATGGAGWYAGLTSTNVSNNTGWTFSAPPAGGTSNPGNNLQLMGVG